MDGNIGRELMINAIRFVKLCGIDKIKSILADGDVWKNFSIVMTSDLKQIVEAFDLVEFCGGIDIATELDEDLCGDNYQEIQKAIKLVGQCQ